MDPRSFIMGNGCPGDRIVGQIISEPKLQQMKVKFGKGLIKGGQG